MPKEESFPIPLKYIAVTRTTHTSLDVLLGKHIEDDWNADEDRELSDASTGWFHKIYLLNERPPDETNDLKTRQCRARYLEAYV